MKIRLSILALLAAAGILAAQSRWVVRLTDQNQTLAARQRDQAGAALAPGELDHLRQTVAQSDELRARTRDIHKLRNQVRQLREERRELENLRALNTKLKSALANAESDPDLKAFQREYVLADQFTHAGFGSPEATVQTFFWAIRNGDLDAMAQCLIAKEAESFAALSDDDKEAAAVMFQKEFENLPGVHLTRDDSNPPEASGDGIQAAHFESTGAMAPSTRSTVTMQIQSVFGGRTMPITLVWENNGWKITEGPW